MDPRDQARQIGIVDSCLGKFLGTGSAINPGNTTVISSTVALAGGYYDVTAFVSVSVAVGLQNAIFRWRNAADTGDILSQELYSPGAYFFPLYLKNLPVAVSEKFQVYVHATFVGIILGTIIAVRRA